MSVKDNIKRLRELANITQEDLASIADVSRSAVSLWEIGTSEPRMGAVQRIADHFHLKKSNIIESGGMDNIRVGLSGRLYELESDATTLTKDEWELVKLYRAANAQGKVTIMAVANVQQGMEVASDDGKRKAG